MPGNVRERAQQSAAQKPLLQIWYFGLARRQREGRTSFCVGIPRRLRRGFRTVSVKNSSLLRNELSSLSYAHRSHGRVLAMNLEVFAHMAPGTHGALVVRRDERTTFTTKRRDGLITMYFQLDKRTQVTLLAAALLLNGACGGGGGGGGGQATQSDVNAQTEVPDSY